MQTHILHACLLLATAIGANAPSAHAEVWGYIDEQGRPHVATTKLDDRYQLFFKGRSSADVPPPSARDIVADEAFERTAIFRRVEGHPNVKRFEPLIERYAAQHDVDPALVKAMVAVESAYDPNAVSAKGALGLMQVIPETGERYGVSGDAKRTVAEQLFDPAINLRVGTRYLSDLLAMFENDVELALAAYNAGEAVVLRYGNRVPPFPETQEFVKLVRQFHALYRPPPPPPAAPSRITIPRQPAGTR